MTAPGLEGPNPPLPPRRDVQTGDRYSVDKSNNAYISDATSIRGSPKSTRW